MFDKIIYKTNNLCLSGITNFTTISFDENKASFLIDHDGLMDSENPYKFEVEFTSPTDH